MRIAAVVRAAIGAGRFPVGQFLPCTRELAATHGLSPETVRCAMKMLEADGLLRAEPRHGFQVVRRTPGKQPRVVAYVLGQEKQQSHWHPFSAVLLAAFQRVAEKRGSSVVGIPDSPEAMDHIRKINACGVILDSEQPALVARLHQSGLPVVTAEVWDPDGRFDAVIQDNFSGALQAAAYLAQRGHKRIAWYGPTTQSIQAVERWGGAVAGLRRCGIAVQPDLILDADRGAGLDQLQATLTRPDRPTALIALWSTLAGVAAGAARKAGLQLGRELELVGWTIDEEYAHYAMQFAEGRVPVAVTWRSETLAETALARLFERIAWPDLPKARINIETRLRYE
jgi:DNA-binding LacI/PurR family transcriptional regulator